MDKGKQIYDIVDDLCVMVEGNALLKDVRKGWWGKMVMLAGTEADYGVRGAIYYDIEAQFREAMAKRGRPTNTMPVAYRTAKSIIEAAYDHGIKLIEIDEDTGEDVPVGKTSVERQVKQARAGTPIEEVGGVTLFIPDSCLGLLRGVLGDVNEDSHPGSEKLYMEICARQDEVGGHHA